MLDRPGPSRTTARGDGAAVAASLRSSRRSFMPGLRLIGLIRHYCAPGHVGALVGNREAEPSPTRGTDEGLPATFDGGIIQKDSRDLWFRSTCSGDLLDSWKLFVFIVQWASCPQFFARFHQPIFSSKWGDLMKNFDAVNDFAWIFQVIIA